MNDHLIAMMALAWSYFSLGVSLAYFLRGVRAANKEAKR